MSANFLVPPTNSSSKEAALFAPSTLSTKQKSKAVTAPLAITKIPSECANNSSSSPSPAKLDNTSIQIKVVLLVLDLARPAHQPPSALLV